MKVIENESQFNEFLSDLKKMDPDRFFDVIAGCQHCEDAVEFYEKLLKHFEEENIRTWMIKSAIGLLKRRQSE